MPVDVAQFFRRFTAVFLSDDIDGFMGLIDDECVWEIMATGEVFAGAAKVRVLAERSVAARTHTADLHMRFDDHIVTADRMCLEYIREGVVTENWPASENRRPLARHSSCPFVWSAACGTTGSFGCTNTSTSGRSSPAVEMPGCTPELASSCTPVGPSARPTTGERADELRGVEMVLRRKLSRAFGVLFTIPIAVAGVVVAAYLVLLGWTTLLRVKWVNDRTRKFSTTANRSVPGKIAGTRLGSLYFNLSALHHVGRRSGRTYVTPLGAFPLGDGFVLAVAYDDVDWYHNVLAAGKCTLTWQGQEYALEKPEVISAADALKAYPLPVKPFIVAAGMKKFLWLHRSGSDEGDGA